MKRKWIHPEESPSTSIAWKSGGQLAGSIEARSAGQREFPPGVDTLEEGENGLTRRNFVRYMGASTALMGLAGVGCRRPEGYLVPYTKNVEWVLPGEPLLYATSRPWCDGAVPLVVTTHEGRPTKLEGNPLHPYSTGTSDVLTQASVLDIYDPDRSKHALSKGERISKLEMKEALERMRLDLRDAGGAGTGFLIGRGSSPTRQRLIERMREEFPEARWFRYEALVPEGLELASAQAFGEGVRSVVAFDRVDRVLALDCDFLGVENQDASAQARFASRRKPEDENFQPSSDMARLYVAEPAMSLTGGMADHRARVSASQIFNFAVLIAREIAAITEDGALGSLVADIAISEDRAPFDKRWIRECAVDLAGMPGRSAVLLGGRHSETAHLLVIAINKALGAYGADACIDLMQTGLPVFEDLAALRDAVAAGDVVKLIATSPANPAYDTPADFGWQQFRAGLESFIHLGFSVNHTAISADLHIPGTSYLEEWGDVRDNRGVYSVIQPMILPLYGGVSENALYLQLLSEEPLISEAGEDENAIAGVDSDPVMLAVRETLEVEWLALGGAGAFADIWSSVLRDGFLVGSVYPASGAEVVVNELTGAADLVGRTPSADALELIFQTDASVYDGRFINNAWLQEMPDPVSKLTWDNAALLSPETAKALGVFAEYRDDLQQVPMVRLNVDNQSVEIPVLIAFGQADFSISLPLGYGQLGKTDKKNEVGDSMLPMSIGVDCGFDVNPLRRMGAAYIAVGATAEPSGRNYEVALLQEHSTMHGRAIVREGTLERYQKDQNFAAFEAEDSHIPENISLYKNKDRDGNPQINDKRHQWAMVIDLNQCTGCNACLVACQAENNIPIVGKDQVRRGRAMHWIRMDRYFVAQQDKDGRYINEDNPEMLMQPVACMQCEMAPCTTVCPVNATITAEDGLNIMAYNRCIGTRYCANNCPYKARRFNFFDYNKRPLDELYRGPLSSKSGVPQSKQLQKNPNVSVRMRGVMEKCTYCIQRLESAKHKTSQRRREKPRELGVHSTEVSYSVEELRVPTDSVKVACQQACPTEAIIFGNLLDEKSAVSKLKFIDEKTVDRPIVSKHPRNYELLKYIGALPRTSYLARIKNVNPNMPDARYIGNATVHLH